MEKLSFYIALWSAKAGHLASRILRRGGTTAPGKLALAICPDFLQRIGRPETLIGVTGTNGKTTVTNMLCDMFEALGETPVSNRKGANIDAGAATALLAAASLSGKCRRKLGVLEMDERSAARLFPVLKPDYLVVTNLFRDSMRRNAHPEYIKDLMDGSIGPSIHLVLNADDPISSSLAPLNPRTLFSVDKLAQDLDTEINAGEAKGKAVSLVAETKDGKHSFRVKVAPPEGRSFARDIAEKYGVTYESLTKA